MALDTYRRKRDFKATSEPEGVVASSEGGHSFVVQKHAARRLHYDFRLELDGVLKSWAVTRGPSLVPGDKRLAVHVEDHPLDYGEFEGTIPKGEYGGGTVLLWDRGSWEPLGDPHRAYAKGHIEFVLHGAKLRGRWHLVRMHGKPRDRHENWLLIKGEDDEARAEGEPDVLDQKPASVKTGRLVEEIAGEKPGWSSKTGRISPEAADAKPATPRKRATAKSGAKPEREMTSRQEAKPKPKPKPKSNEEPLPDFVEPQLATLVAQAPRGTSWVHEIKFDGYRILARLEAGRVKLLTRTGLDWTHRFGQDIPRALQALAAETALIDGEVVVENDAGASDFSALQAELSAGGTDRFVLAVFDLLHLDGEDLRPQPLLRRKERLAGLVGEAGTPLRFIEHFRENGELVLRHACRLSLEGVISKQGASLYRSGRGKDWVKSKCSHRQEFVVAGYVPSTSARRAIGSLVLGTYEEGELVIAGRVGTGFSNAVSEALFARLDDLRVPRSPFARRLDAEEARGVRFVEPQLVAEIEFRGWTADHHLRHASFRGLREDKAPENVRRETAEEQASKVEANEAEVSKAEASKAEASKAGTTMSKPETKPETKTATSTKAKARPAPRPAVTLTHPDRIYWPEAGVTKQGLADYYAEVWPRMGPHVAGRPLSLVRCPGGIAETCFFQKHAWQGIGRAIRQVPDPGDPEGDKLLVIDDVTGLIGLVQAGVLEVHPWGSMLAAIDTPDLIVLDLDPGDGVGWPEVIAAAVDVRDRLQAAGLASFVKTSGGKGLHVVAPLVPRAGWDEAKAFAKGIAEAMAADAPDRFVAVVSKAKRKGRILVDYLRNGRGATAVAPYSTRARAGAPVSMPLGWSELGEAIGPNYFTVANAPARLASLAKDPWADFRRAASPLPGEPKLGRRKA